MRAQRQLLLLALASIAITIVGATDAAATSAIRRPGERECRMIASALMYYGARHNHLPPASSSPPPAISWRVQILPEIDYQAVYEQYDHHAAWNDKSNEQ